MSDRNRWPWTPPPSFLHHHHHHPYLHHRHRHYPSPCYYSNHHYKPTTVVPVPGLAGREAGIVVLGQQDGVHALHGTGAERPAAAGDVVVNLQLCNRLIEELPLNLAPAAIEGSWLTAASRVEKIWSIICGLFVCLLACLFVCFFKGRGLLFLLLFSLFVPQSPWIPRKHILLRNCDLMESIQL